MKNILIVGSTSYIGKSFERWINENSIPDIKLDFLSLRDNLWNRRDLNEYDTVIYLAAIVHSPKVKPSLYYEINRDLTLKFASSAKEAGIKHFIFFSTLSVYGLDEGKITKYTKLKPTNDYGKSKLAAEKKLQEIEDDYFKVSIIRSPLVYGPNSPGNFCKLLNFFDILPIFPMISNNRSMIFIDNLSNFIYLLVINEYKGVFIPQNSQYVQTQSIYKHYRNGKKKPTIFIPGYFFKPWLKKNTFTKKIFGDLIVDTNTLNLPIDYQIVEFEQSMKIIVNKTNT